MAIPDGKLYHDGPLSAGTIATIEDSSVNTEHAGTNVGFGTGVVLNADGKAVPATSGAIYGIAIKRTYVDSDHLYKDDIENDCWKTGETLGVLRDGTIAVPITVDVDRGENAALDAGGKFKVAGASDTIVGVFLSDGNAGSTANLQTRAQFVAQQAQAPQAPSNNSSK